MACPFLILERSAIPNKIKRETLLQEGLRRLRNIDNQISEEENINIMTDFSNSMRISGYSQIVRFETIKGIMMRQRQVELEIIEGVRKRYRSGAEIRSQKSSKMGKSLNTWFLRAGNTCTLSVQCTPGSKLKKVVHSNIGNIEGPTGSIGMDLTGELAAIVMIIWDRKFLHKCQKLGISLPTYTRYVDDTLNGLKAIGTDYNYNTKSNRKIYGKNTSNSPIDKHMCFVL